MKIRPVGADLFHTKRRTDGQADKRQTKRVKQSVFTVLRTLQTSLIKTMNFLFITTVLCLRLKRFIIEPGTFHAML